MSLSKSRATKKIAEIFQKKIFQIMADSGQTEIKIKFECECGDLTEVSINHHLSHSIEKPHYSAQGDNVH